MTAYFRDPHVVSLSYRIERSEGVTFADDTGPAEREFDAFRLSVTHETVTAHMKDHHETEQGARGAVEGYLRPWEIYEAVRPMGTGVRFSFEAAEVVDRDPPPIYSTARAAPTIGSASRVEVVRELRLPDLPEAFAMSSDVEVMWTLYECYLQGRDRLLPMAYTCLTRFRYGSGGNKEAASRYHVDINVLKKLGRLSSTLGDETAARKWDSGHAHQPLSEGDREWVEDAVKLLIYRAGQYASDPDGEWPKITMNTCRSCRFRAGAGLGTLPEQTVELLGVLRIEGEHAQ
jgi:hypothetical protein